MPNPDLILGIVGPLLQLPLLIILVRGKQYLRFPFFCTYTVFSIILSALVLWAMGHAALFFVLYWVADAVLGVMGLFALHEAFEPSLKAWYEDYRRTRLIPPLTVLVILSISLYRAVYHPLGNGPLDRLAAGVYSFEVAVRLLQILIFILALKLGRREHHHIGSLHPFGIVAGFGVAASGALLADLFGLALAAKFGSGFELVFRYLPSATYAAAALGWLFTFIAKEPPRPQPSQEEIDRRMEDQQRTRQWLKKRGLFRWSNA
jgi:hypothetical protein